MVKCAKCGYLAVRDRRSYSLVESGNDYREKGTVPNRYDEKGMNPHSVHEQQPVCFVQRYDLRAEVKQAFATGKDERGCVSQVITKERDCDKFTDWQQGLTPKEHREMLDRQWMLDFQAKREQEDRDWREGQRQEDLAWRENQERKAEGRHRWDLIITGGIATLVISAATIIAALISKGR